MKIARFGMIAGLTVLSLSVAAQDTVNEDTHVSKKEKAMNALDLSDDQLAQIEVLRTSTHEKLEELKADTSMEQDAKRAEMKAIKQESKESMEAILTDEQREKLAAMKAAGNETTPEEIAQRQTNKMKEVLDLTPEQEEQLHALNLKVAQKIDAVKKNESLTEEQKKEFIKGNKKDKRTAMASILTEEQMATWEAHLAKKKQLKAAKKNTENASE